LNGQVLGAADLVRGATRRDVGDDVFEERGDILDRHEVDRVVAVEEQGWADEAFESWLADTFLAQLLPVS
jgi:hypothetical protein